MFNLIKKTILEFVEADESLITQGTHFVRDLHLTSYDVVSIIGRLENDLGVEIPDREIRNLETVGDLMEYLNQRSCDL
jgi:acyl carrier protein